VVLMYLAGALSAGDVRVWKATPGAIRWDEVAKIALPGAALIAAVVGAVIAAYGHQARVEELALSRDSDVTDRYTRAVEQLGNFRQAAIRLGGIYALERIHHDSARDRTTIENLLHTFVVTTAMRSSRAVPERADAAVEGSPPRPSVIEELGANCIACSPEFPPLARSPWSPHSARVVVVVVVEAVVLASSLRVRNQGQRERSGVRLG
jgi:hypothetical protein